MRRFKMLDISVQLLILMVSITCFILGYFPLFASIFFVGFLGWNLFSIVLHLFLSSIPLPKFKHRRSAILIHVLIIITFPFLASYFQIFKDYFVLYILYVSIMPFYYLWLSYRELQLLDEIHDQITLLDIGQH